MRSLTRPLLALLALSPLLHARLEENLPATTYGIVKIESVEKTRKHLADNPVAAAFKTGRFTEFLKPITDKLGAEDGGAKLAEFEKQRDALLADFTGEVVFAVVKTPDTVTGHLPYDYILLADTTADEAAIADLLKKLDLHQPVAADAAGPASAKSGDAKPMADEDDEDGEPMASKDGRPRLVSPEIFSGEEAHNGVTLHTLSVKMDDKPVVLAGWAIVGKTFVYATAPNVLRDLVDARRDGRKDNFAEQAVYKANREAIGDADAWVLLNLPAITGTLREMVVEKAKGADGETKPGILGMDTVKAYDSLGLDALGHLRVAFTLKPGDTRSDTSLAWSENRGIVRLITDSNPRDAVPDLTVMPSGVVTAGAGRTDFSKFLARFEAMMKEALPLGAPMFDMQVDRLKKDEALDIRGALLENFGDEVWSFTDRLPAESDDRTPDSAPFVVVFSLKDENKLNSFIETAAGKAAPQTGDGVKSLFDERELLGVKVRTVKNLPPSVPSIRYAITKGRVFLSVGGGKLLDRTLAQFNDPKGGLSAEPAFKEGLAKLPKGANSVGYYDLGEYFAMLGQTFVKTYNMKAGANTDDARFDPAKAPVASDMPFVVLSGSYLHEKEATSRTIVIRKPDAKN